MPPIVLLTYYCVAILVASVLGGMLPGWLRLVIGVLIVIECVHWLGTRLLSALRFNPSLSELALRAERIYPELTGVLASSVEFAATPDGAFGGTDQPHARSLTQMALARAKRLADGVDLSRLIDRSSAMKRLAVTVLTVLVFGTVIFNAPQASGTAAARWLAPLGATQWPRRVVIEEFHIGRGCRIAIVN